MINFFRDVQVVFALQFQISRCHLGNQQQANSEWYKKRNNEVPSLNRAEGFVSPVSDEPADNLGSGRCIAIEFNLNQ